MIRWIHTMLTTAACALLLIAPESQARAHGEDGTIPPILYTTIQKFDQAYPTFVSASAAVDKEGHFDQTLFHPQVIDLLQHLTSNEWLRDGCYTHTEFYDDELFLPNRSDLRLAITNSPVVLLGKVVDREYGFYGAAPGQLIAVMVEESFKGSAPLPTHFLFIPIGTFEAGPYRFCKTDHRYAEPPSIGERVLVLLPHPIDDPDERFLDIATAEGVVVLEKDGGTRVPWSFTAGEPDMKRISAGSVLDLARRLSADQEAQ